jgi:hypothetical protein
MEHSHFLIPWQCFPVRKRDERLFRAAREGETKTCEDLLIGGANVNVRDVLGEKLNISTVGIAMQAAGIVDIRGTQTPLHS